MKILYGVQGTGNGHLTRARKLSHYLKAAGHRVDYIFSGRDAQNYYAMDNFGDWRCLRGMTFSVVRGRIRPIQTALNLRPFRLLRDIRSVPIHDYDLVITDFEPVTAWAAHLKKVACLGIGHQYAFDHPIPKAGDNILTRTTLRKFAPASHSIGMHWYHYQQPILPPIVDIWEEAVPSDPKKIIVYLPFEREPEMTRLLLQCGDYHFLYYGQFNARTVRDNITYKPVSREGFQRDLARSGGVICNAGFELASEAISLGKKLLVKPVQGQMEQLSNALALQGLGLGRSTDKLHLPVIRAWLGDFEGKRIRYPNVAKHIVEWIEKGDFSNREGLANRLWAQTDLSELPNLRPFESGAAALETVSS